MTNTTRRITLVLGNAECSIHHWESSSRSGSRMIFIPKLALLHQAIHGGLSGLREDVERVVLDGCASATEFLDLLASLPTEFVGDVVFGTEEGSGFISAMGRGGDRVLHAFNAIDLDFYLETYGLLDHSSMTFAIPDPAFEFAVVAAA